jgi:hypothetical protein
LAGLDEENCQWAKDRPGLRVGTLEVVDELGQVLDGVDVVVGRRGDEAHSRHRVAGPGYLLTFQHLLLISQYRYFSHFTAAASLHRSQILTLRFELV